MRIVIGGVQSGVGKTTITAGLIAAFRNQGLSVQPFKVGPDYIDPTYHTLAAGHPCRNLNTWMISPERLKALFHHHAKHADISIIEGVMGLFDGQNYLNDTGSTAQVAKLTDSPVILVIDAGKIARSAAATALGFKQFDPELRLAGFIINHVAGENHGQGVTDAIKQATGLPVLGYLPRNPKLEIPERHLGLVPTAEPGRWQDFIDSAAEHISRHINLNTLIKIAREAPPHSAENLFANLKSQRLSGSNHSPLIAVARDEAFNFIYEENLDLLRAAGADITFFSPLRDTELPPNTNGIILSGGFPEVYAEKISVNTGMRRALQNAQARSLPIYAECGGLMALTQSITDLQGREYPMFGLLPGRSVMTQKLNMGYRQAQAVVDSWFMQCGEEVRGHEFHYSVWEGRPKDITPAYIILPSNGHDQKHPEGVCMGSLWASYVHLPFWTKPELALRFVERCAEANKVGHT